MHLILLVSQVWLVKQVIKKCKWFFITTTGCCWNANTYDLIWRLSKSNNVSEFKSSMKLLKTTNIKAYDYMTEINIRHFFRYAIQHNVKSDHLTVNNTLSITQLFPLTNFAFSRSPTCWTLKTSVVKIVPRRLRNMENKTSAALLVVEMSGRTEYGEPPTWSTYTRRSTISFFFN